MLREVVPVAVERASRRILALWMAPYPGYARRQGSATPGAARYAAPSFVDASYEGDLAALAGASYRVGREGRSEYGEPHAGRVFTTLKRAPGAVATYPHAAVSGALNLRAFFAITGELFAGSTGEGDRALQAYNLRLSLTRDPERRVAPPRPNWYPRELFLALRDRWGFGGNAGSANAYVNGRLECPEPARRCRDLSRRRLGGAAPGLRATSRVCAGPAPLPAARRRGAGAESAPMRRWWVSTTLHSPTTAMCPGRCTPARRGGCLAGRCSPSTTARLRGVCSERPFI